MWSFTASLLFHLFYSFRTAHHQPGSDRGPEICRSGFRRYNQQALPAFTWKVTHCLLPSQRLRQPSTCRLHFFSGSHATMHASPRSMRKSDFAAFSSSAQCSQCSQTGEIFHVWTQAIDRVRLHTQCVESVVIYRLLERTRLHPQQITVRTRTFWVWSPFQCD